MHKNQAFAHYFWSNVNQKVKVICNGIFLNSEYDLGHSQNLFIYAFGQELPTLKFDEYLLLTFEVMSIRKPKS